MFLSNILAQVCHSDTESWLAVTWLQVDSAGVVWEDVVWAGVASECEKRSAD